MERTEEISRLASLGLSSRQIGAEVGLSYQGVINICKREGITLDGTRGPRRHGEPRKYQSKASPLDYWGQLEKKASTCAIGAAGELIVCADLLKRGWTVFRNVSLHGFCDLIACKGERIVRIEVKAVRLSTAKPIVQREKFDVLAKALPDMTVIYEPEID